MTLCSASRPFTSARRFRPTLECLEQRDCPTNNAPTMVLNLDYESQGQVTLHGTVTDEDPSTCVIFLSGPVQTMIWPDANGNFSYTTTPSGTGAIQGNAFDDYSVSSDDVFVNVIVNEESQPPVITGFTASFLGGTMWMFSGWVQDESPAGLTVRFGGLPSLQYTSVQTQSDGSFSFCVELGQNEEGAVTAWATDGFTLVSEIAEALVKI